MVEHRYPEKFGERYVLRMDQPLEAYGPEQNGKEVSYGSKDRPERINAFQKGIKVFEGDLGEEKEDDTNGNKDRKEKPLQWKDLL